MNELLSNPTVQTALIAAIVVGLNALVAWFKKTFPTLAASVDSNWCYIQPLVEQAMAKAQYAFSKSTFSFAGITEIIDQSVIEFKDSYRKLEGKDATAKEIEAARAEITAAVARVTGG